ncbi:MAG: hypothetical protein IKL41_00115, partial [Clostridia bacterium]|nr:hypothetical protein [Clostridia bacterium]
TSKIEAPFDCAYKTEGTVLTNNKLFDGVEVKLYLLESSDVYSYSTYSFLAADFKHNGTYYRVEGEYMEFEKFYDILQSIISTN